MNKKNVSPRSSGIVYSTDPHWDDTAPDTELPALLPAQQRLRLEYSRSGRGGKDAIIITGFVGESRALGELARYLKTALGCGGSVRGSEILIQGNKREQIISLLKNRGYTDVK